MPPARLSSLDASFLRVESPTAHMHVAWKGHFAARPDGGRPTIEALRRSIGARLRFAERFRQRVAFPPAGLHEPVWVDDPGFDIERHVVALSPARVALSRLRFDELCDVVLSAPLDRARPLWEVHLAPRLEDGTVGLLMKIHHAVVDGMSAVELALLLLDFTPDAVVPPADDWQPRGLPGQARLALDALADRGIQPLRAALGIAAAAASPRSGARLAGTLRRAALALGEDVLRPAPASRVNVPIGARRTLVHHSAPLEPLLQARTRLGVTLNDVALATVAGALRATALDAGREPEALKAMVPVSLRDADEPATLGNRISFVFVDLPVHLPGVADRVAAVQSQTERFKRQRRAEGGETILAALGLLPAPLKDVAARLASGPRMYNLTVSNVPGPRIPVFLHGCRLEEAVPVIPVPDGHAVSIGIFSYGDRVTFGAYGDPGALPEITALPAAIAAARIEIESLGAARRQRRAGRAAA